MIASVRKKQQVVFIKSAKCDFLFFNYFSNHLGCTGEDEFSRSRNSKSG